MAEAERRETNPSQVIDDYIEAIRFNSLAGNRVYGSVLEMKTLLNRITTKARVKGVDLEDLGLPVAKLGEKLNLLHTLLLELGEVDLSGRPQGEPVEPMTLEQELRLEIEHERFYDLGEDAS